MTSATFLLQTSLWKHLFGTDCPKEFSHPEIKLKTAVLTNQKIELFGWKSQKVSNFKETKQSVTVKVVKIKRFTYIPVIAYMR